MKWNFNTKTHLKEKKLHPKLTFRNTNTSFSINHKYSLATRFCLATSGSFLGNQPASLGRTRDISTCKDSLSWRPACTSMRKTSNNMQIIQMRYANNANNIDTQLMQISQLSYKTKYANYTNEMCLNLN